MRIVIPVQPTCRFLRPRLATTVLGAFTAALKPLQAFSWVLCASIIKADYTNKDTN
jgi:hypothetical protein